MSRILAIGTQPPTDREIAIGCPMLEQPASGWDILREILWLPHPFFIRRGQERDGPGPEGGRFIVQDIQPAGYKGGRPVVEVTSLGIAFADGKDYKIECSAGLTEDLDLAADAISPTIWRLQYPRVTKLWVSLTTPAIYDHVGIASVPPETFGIGGSAWGMSWVAADNWTASGWIGETRLPQQLPGSKACLVTDTWLYDPGYEDRDHVAPEVIYL